MGWPTIFILVFSWIPVELKKLCDRWSCDWHHFTEKILNRCRLNKRTSDFVFAKIWISNFPFVNFALVLMGKLKRCEIKLLWIGPKMMGKKRQINGSFLVVDELLNLKHVHLVWIEAYQCLRWLQSKQIQRKLNANLTPSSTQIHRKLNQN